MPQFLSANDVYRIIQRELPEDVYPDGPASAYYSTADSMATASGVADLYANAEIIYDNLFPGSCNEKLGDWENSVFGHPGDATQASGVRIGNILTQLRSLRSMSRPDILAVCQSNLPSGVYVELAPLTGPSRAWRVGRSRLGRETYLGGDSVVGAVGPGLCAGCTDPAEFGYTAAQWALLQRQAYSYEVRIYQYQLSTVQRAVLDAALNAAEPGRSQHIITDNLPASAEFGNATGAF